MQLPQARVGFGFSTPRRTRIPLRPSAAACASRSNPLLPSLAHRPTPPMEGGTSASHPPGPGELLLSRFVRFEDEISEFIKDQGLPSLDTTMEAALEGIPESQKQTVMQRELLRYRQTVEKSAEDALRQRKSCCPSDVKRVPVRFTGGDDPVFYGQALQGIEPRFTHLAHAPEVTSLVLRVSWPRCSSLYGFPPGAHISSADQNMLALYVGTYRPCIGLRGFYLAYDVLANSVAVIPQLPPGSVSMFSHLGIGTGVAVLSCGDQPGEFLLAELLLRKQLSRPSCKATLFKWFSSGPSAGQWVQNEVALCPVSLKSTNPAPLIHSVLILSPCSKESVYVGLTYFREY